MQTNSAAPVQDYLRPQSIDDALARLASGDVRILAGGSDIYPGAGSRLAGAVVDVTGIPSLRGIKAGNGLRIGAATSWTEISEAQLPRAVHALQAAARQVGGRQVQNTGTIGGNLCNASPAADGVPPLLALDAVVELVSPKGTRRLPVAEFITGPRQTALHPSEVMTAILIPEASLAGRSAFVKLGARSHLVISIAMVAVRLTVDGDRVASAAIAIGSCSPTAVRLPAVEAALAGRPSKDVLAHVRSADINPFLNPIDDIRASAEYRAAVAVELIRRAVTEALT